MRRREFIAGLGGAAAASTLRPQAAHAQQAAKIYRLGILTTRSGPAALHHAFEAALTDLGYREKQNLLIERRYASGDLERLQVLAAELVRAKVDVIVTETSPAALAAKKTTATIPIVMATSGDAVGSGLVESLARPGGNVTGMTFMSTDLVGKRLELLQELKSQIRRVAFLGNGAIVPEQLAFGALQKMALTLGVQTEFVDVRVPQGFERAFEAMTASGTDAVMVAESAAYTEVRDRIVEPAARYRLPALYGRREFVDAGGLVSYATSFVDLFRHAAIFVDKILKGAKPADLPVMQPTKFELAINLKTAKALGLTVPPSLLARADEVIE
jgi:putative ABC transport system substrate-binding protein